MVCGLGFGVWGMVLGFLRFIVHGLALNLVCGFRFLVYDLCFMVCGL